MLFLCINLSSFLLQQKIDEKGKQIDKTFRPLYFGSSIIFVIFCVFFQRLAFWLLSNGAVPLKFDEATRAKARKCSESMWKLTYYATVEACIVKITCHEPWVMDSKGYFRGWPNQELPWVIQMLQHLMEWIPFCYFSIQVTILALSPYPWRAMGAMNSFLPFQYFCSMF